MNLYLSQLKSLLYKNYKLKKESGLKRSLLFQILIHIIIIIFLNFSNKRYYHYPRENALLPFPINDFYLKRPYDFAFKPINGKISFYIPLKSNGNENRDIFVNNLISNKLFTDSTFLEPKIFDDINSFNEFNEVTKEKELMAAVVFNNNYTDYTIRVPYDYSVDPDLNPIENDYDNREITIYRDKIFQVIPEDISGGLYFTLFNQTISTQAGKYLISFAPIQAVVNQAIIQTKTNKTMNLNFNVGKLSKAKYDFEVDQDFMITKFSKIKMMIYPLLFIIQSMSIMLAIIGEKEKGQEQGLIVIGVHPSTIWLSWEILYLPVNLFVSISTAFMEHYKKNLFKSINIVSATLFLIIYGISTYKFAILMTKIFKKKRPAVFAYTILFVTYLFVYEDIYKLIHHYPVLLYFICVIFSPFNLFVTLGRLFQKNRSLDKSVPYNSKFFIHFILLLCSILLYHLIITTVEFFSLKISNLSKRNVDFTETNYFEEDIEEDPKNCGDPLIQVKNIFKVYKKRSNHLFSNKSVSVLKNVSFNIYNNEIFAILGHNAAGKSTLIKIMTSILRADHGHVYYKGLDLVSNVKLIRKNIGLCLQDTIVFDKLTVEDNLKIFAGLKGVDLDIESILEDIALTSKRDSKMNELSGGQRRKVSIGVSLVGNPKYIFLDEPTTSLDPFSRRKIWDILLKIRNNRVIILCTHYMDEADILADRKMIISNGRIRCLGSSVYLKNHFNMKYFLNIETKIKYKDEIGRIISNYIPDAIYSDLDSRSISYTKNDNGKEDQINCLTWTLPMSSTNNYSDLFTELESLKGKLINRISLDSPYLEDLFIRLTSEVFEKKNITDNSKNDVHSDLQSNQLMSEEDEQLPKLNNVQNPTFFNKTMRLVKYRFIISLRDRMFLFIYVIVPIIIIGLFVNTLKDSFRGNKTIELGDRIVSSPKMYIGNQFNYALNNSNINDTLTGDIIQNTISTSINVENTDKEWLPSLNLEYDLFNETKEEVSLKVEGSIKKEKNSNINLTYYNTIEMDILGQFPDIDLNSELYSKLVENPNLYNNPNIDPFQYYNFNSYSKLKDLDLSSKPNSYYISSFNINLTNNTYEFDIYYNDTLSHSIPVTINVLSNALLSLNGIPEQIVTHSHPLSKKDNLTFFDKEKILIMVLSACIIFVIGFFGPMIIQERKEKLLKLLNLSGITNKSYLLATFVVNWILLYILVLFIIVVGAIFGLKVFHNFMNVVILAIVLIPCCFSTIAFQYLVSFSFNNDLSYLLNILINFLPVAIFLSEIVDYEIVYELTYDPFLSFKNELYRTFLSTVIPLYNIPMAIFKMIKFYMFRNENHIEINFLSLFKVKNGFLLNFVSSIISFLVVTFIAIVVFNNNKIMHKNRIGKRSKKAIEKNILRLKELDDDLYKEYQRVTNESIQHDSLPSISIQKDNTDENREREIIIKKEKSSVIPIRVINVGKEYELKNISDPNKIVNKVNDKDTKYGEYHYSDYNSGLVVTSLKNVTLGINSQECFGLIGPNGSGKTTLLNIITYNHAQSVGSVYYDDIENVDIKEDHFMMGYCSQNDVLWEELTLYEHLIMFIYLRGYSKEESKKYAKMYMEFCRIEDHKDKYPHELSGGTRRKLCILIALIGFSNKIMLDEPSSGVDPATRRYIWNILTNYKHNEDSLLVLTTHSMEEAEILCDRIGMLVNGELLALGTANQLKMKFGNKYMLDIQCTDAKLIDDWIKKDIPLMINEAVCEFKSDKRLKYMFQVTDNHGEIFKVMENYKTRGVVIDYSFSQNTLEDVFLKFAQFQENQEI